MRVTANIDDTLMSTAQEVTGIEEQAALLTEGLKALIEQGSTHRLALLGGSESGLEEPPRRRGSIAKDPGLA